MTKLERALGLTCKADLRKLYDVGHYPCVEDKAALRLARAIHAAESTHCATSWSAQERAQDFFNEHGLGATLDECERLEALQLIEDCNYRRQIIRSLSGLGGAGGCQECGECKECNGEEAGSGERKG